MKKLIIILIIAFISSCNILKDKQKTKINSSEKKDVVETITRVTEEKRPGGNLKATILPEEKRPRNNDGSLKAFLDKFKDGPLTKTVYYKPDGSVDVNCIADEVFRRIEEKKILEDNTITDTSIKKKSKIKEEGLKSITVLYFMTGLALVVFVIIFLLFKNLSKNTKLLTEILRKEVNI